MEFSLGVNVSDPTNQRVLTTVWPWKEKVRADDTTASGRPRWVRGVIQFLIMLTIGFVLYRFVGHQVMGQVVWGLAIVVLSCALFIPKAFEGIESFGRKLGLWVGIGLSYLLLVPFFYMVFVPGRLILWILGKDPMQRGFPTDETSCWSPRKTKMDERHYRKQFS